MNWDYFVKDGAFQAKRLPSAKKPVRIKDVTDLGLLRDYLRDSVGMQECISAYEHCFDGEDLYEVEVETFEEFFNRNPDKFLGDAGKLKGRFDILEELMEGDGNSLSGDWIYLDDSLGKPLAKLGIVEPKPIIDDEDWVEYLGWIYTKKRMVELGKEYAMQLKGTKAQMAVKLMEAIKSGAIKHDAPFPVKPGDNLMDWFGELQEKYLDLVDLSLSGFNYPPHFVEAVFYEIRSENQLYSRMVDLLTERYPSHALSVDERFAEVAISLKPVHGYGQLPKDTTETKSSREPNIGRSSTPAFVLITIFFALAILWMLN